MHSRANLPLEERFPMTDFKVGDQIVFKTEGELVTEYSQNPEDLYIGDDALPDIVIPFCFNRSMRVFCGKKGVITKVSSTTWRGIKIQRVWIRFRNEELTRASREWSFSGPMIKKAYSYKKEVIQKIFVSNYQFEQFEPATMVL
jgi:hypothetical protein